MGYMAYNGEASVVPVAINTFYNITCLSILVKKKDSNDYTSTDSYGDLITVENPTVDDYKPAGQIVLDRIKESI